ncbi:MAG: DNA methyltransferase [Treponema sp.]|nr:DNA methyltransferase [Treponema sp.]
MTQSQQQKAAKKFAQEWKGKGYEKGESQKFWLDLLCNVFGVQNFAEFISFEDQVKLDHTSFIDGYIPSAKVLIEQKSIDKDLRAPVRQSDGSLLNPFQQAKRYITELPVSRHPRWVVTCNFKSFLVYDMENPAGEPEEILLENLEKEYYRLSFLTDVTASDSKTENEHLRRELEISKKAGDIIGEIYDAILLQYKDAKNPSAQTLRSLNMLCVRIVFCLYAEDAGIFGHKLIFGDYLRSFDAKDLRRALLSLFQVLDTKIEERDPYLEENLAQFPYVNGGLFTEEDRTIPQLTDEIKELFVRHASSEFDWSEISPTIFGAIFESTLNPETRRTGGMHYTSIENIHKVIDPLFLDELKGEFEEICRIKTESKLNEKLDAFQDKLGKLRFLDPACGSGNFLTETYLSLRHLENKVISIRNKGRKLLGFDEFIKVNISQFYGIEINDFAVSVAKTALWIAEEQMMEETSKIVDVHFDFLPLKTNAYIFEGNALRMDWKTFRPASEKTNAIYADKANIYKIDSAAGQMSVCEIPSKKVGEVNIITKEVEFKNIEDLRQPVVTPVEFDYIMGNPPFVGYSFRTENQKQDLLAVDNSIGKNIDYVAGWYLKAAAVIQGTRTRCAFVSTNSITQGEQVSGIWKTILEKRKLHIDFAYRTFRWDSESNQKAHVHCVIVGFSDSDSLRDKIIITENGEKIIAKNISPYLIDSENVFIEKRKFPLCNVSKINKGSQPTDGGNLIVEANEYELFLKKEPEAKKYIHEFVGADEFINNKKRYCLWLVNANPVELRKMPLVMRRLEAVRKFRLESSKASTRSWAAYPYLFTENRQPQNGNYLLIPRVSSEKRLYVPIGYLSSDVIASDATQIIPNATLYEFGILTSSVHMAWMRVVCGRLKSDYRYSNDIVYNNFPWPSPDSGQKQKIGRNAQAILDVRAKYPDCSLADLYDGLTMPLDLRKAHQENDRAVLQAYGFPQDATESEIVAKLFKLYQKMCASFS